MKAKFYHTSGTKFKIGDVFGGPGKLVCMTTSPIPHGTISEIVNAGYSSYTEYSDARSKDLDAYYFLRDEWDKNPIGDKPEYPITRNPKPVTLVVYEVKPYKHPTWGGANDEYRLYDNFVEVVRIVGNAKGILDNHERKFGKTAKAWHFGGKAIKIDKEKKIPKGRQLT